MSLTVRHKGSIYSIGSMWPHYSPSANPSRRPGDPGCGPVHPCKLSRSWRHLPSCAPAPHPPIVLSRTHRHTARVHGFCTRAKSKRWIRWHESCLNPYVWKLLGHTRALFGCARACCHPARPLFHWKIVLFHWRCYGLLSARPFHGWLP